MINTLPSCLETLAKSNYQYLEQIIADKYFKFLKLFHMIKLYTAMIDDLEYINDENPLILRISLMCHDKEELNKVYNGLKGYVKESSLDCKISIKGSKVNICINEKEYR